MAQNPPENSFGVHMPQFKSRHRFQLESKEGSMANGFQCRWKAVYSVPYFTGTVTVRGHESLPLLAGAARELTVIVTGFGMRQPYYITYDDLMQFEAEAIRTIEGRLLRRGVIDVEGIVVPDLALDITGNLPQQDLTTFMIAMMKIKEATDGR